VLQSEGITDAETVKIGKGVFPLNSRDAQKDVEILSPIFYPHMRVGIKHVRRGLTKAVTSESQRKKDKNESCRLSTKGERH